MNGFLWRLKYSIYKKQNPVSKSDESRSSDGMFSDIGGTLKYFAKILTYSGIVISCIAGFCVFCVMYDQYENFIMLIPGIGVAVFGSFLSWLASLGLYAFGQLVQNTDIIANNLISQTEKLEIIASEFEYEKEEEIENRNEIPFS